MKSKLLSLISLFLVFNCSAIKKIAPQVVAAYAIARSAHHATYRGILADGRMIEVEMCTKLRETRNANPFELHFSGKIGKKRLTRAQARKWAPLLQEAGQSTFLHKSFWDDSTD